jgi:ABC-type nitrate/sulfonate/bicarbonate transport system substrate-binding protein
MKFSKRFVRLTALATTLGLAACGAVAFTASATSTPTYTVCIDIPFHPLFDYLASPSGASYFANKPYNVKFQILDATTQVPAFGAQQCQVMTTVPSFIPRVTQQYGLKVQYFFPMARWTIGPQILVKKGSPFKTLASLKGKTVSIQPLTSRFGSEEAAIEAATGQNIRTYFKLQETTSAPQQLSLGRVDAAFIEAPDTYPLLQSGNFVAIYSVHDAFLKAFGDPAVMNGGYMAQNSFIKSAPDFIKTLVSATQDVWNKYAQDPTTVNTVASQQSGIPVAALAVVGQVLDLVKMPVKLRAVLPRDVATWQKLFPLLVKSGFIKHAPANPKSLFIVTK